MYFIRSRFYWALLSTLFLAVAATAWYNAFRSQENRIHSDLPDNPVATDYDSPVPGSTTKKVEPVEALVGGLREKLLQNPDSLENWLLLARSYQYLQQDAAAMAAFEHARTLGYEGPGLTSVPPKKLMPATNVAVFNTIKEFADDTTKSASSSPRIRVHISIDETLKDTIRPNDTLFVFARASEGPKIPLAVIRKSAAELPVEVELHDGLAMMPSHRLSQVDKVIIGARLSRSGDAEPGAGDLQTLSEPVIVGERPQVSLVIDKAISTP